MLAAAVTPNIFDVLGVQPAIGRGFRSEEAIAGGNRVLILTDGLRRRR